MIETLGGFAGIDLIGLAVFMPRLVISLVKSGLAKKHVFGSSVGLRGGKLPNSC